MSMFSSRAPLWRLLACTTWVASACADTTDPAGLGPSDGGDGATQTERDAEADAEEPAVDAGSLSDAQVTSGPRDRCFEGECPAPILPRQSDYEFLSEVEDGWLRLIQADWELAPHSEGYRCVRKTMPEDIYITAFAPLSPPGTHHTTLHLENAGSYPDGVTVCGVNAGGTRRLQGAGVGSEPTELPPGVAMKIAAGEQLTVNLHLFNFGDQPLSGTSGTRIKRVPRAQVQHEAATVLAGPLGLNIPPGRATQMGSCTAPAAVTLFSLAPHMHQLGKHMKITLQSASGDRVLLDQDYDFTHQLLYPIEQVQLAAGDKVMLECTYLNETTRTVSWGDSSLDEMCFAGMGLYPTSAGFSPLCTN